MKRHPFSIRGALLAGFAAVFSLWIFTGYELIRSLADAESRVNEVQEDVLKGERALALVRVNVLLGSIYLRDALVDSSAVTRQYYRDLLEQVRTEVAQRLPAYSPEVMSPVEQKHWALLQTELTDYWALIDVVFTSEMPRGPTATAQFLRMRVIPRRETILRILDRLDALQTMSRRRAEVEASVAYDAVRARVLLIAIAAIVAGIFVAWLAARQVARLQREVNRQRDIENETRRDLERLSKRLVDAQEDERRIIARELHDEVGQALTAIKMELGVAQRDAADFRARSSLDGARGLAESALQSVRDLSQLLHPSTLDDLGLPDTLTSYLRGFEKRTGVRAQLTLERMDERLPANIEVSIYRIVQEALTNIARHADATACTVQLSRRDDRIKVVIEDDGVGFDPRLSRAGDARRGMGLIGMKERATSLNGTFTIDNRHEGGTRVTVTMPLPGVAARQAGARLAG